MVFPDLAKWEKILDNTIEKFINEFGKEASLVSLIILSTEDDGHWIETINISKGSIERRHVLEEKNGHLVNLHKSYISNEIHKDDA